MIIYYRISKSEKNVKKVFRAEDVEGHNGEMDMDTLLQVFRFFLLWKTLRNVYASRAWG